MTPGNPHLFVRKVDLECSVGWFPLLDELFIVLERSITEGIENGEWQDLVAKGDPHPWPHVLQIKEKFGRLRVHIGQRTPEMAAAIEAAQTRADVTCDQCGEPGCLRRLGGYMCTRCDLHAEDRGW